MLVVFCCWVSVLLLRVKRVMNAYLSTSSAVLILCKNINKMTARISDFPARRGVASSASGPQPDEETKGSKRTIMDIIRKGEFERIDSGL